MDCYHRNFSAKPFDCSSTCSWGGGWRNPFSGATDQYRKYPNTVWWSQLYLTYVLSLSLEAEPKRRLHLNSRKKKRMWKHWKGTNVMLNWPFFILVSIQERDWNRKEREAEAENYGYSSQEEGFKGNKANQDVQKQQVSIMIFTSKYQSLTDAGATFQRYLTLQTVLEPTCPFLRALNIHWRHLGESKKKMGCKIDFWNL